MWQIKKILHHPHVTWHTASCLCYPQRVGRYACDVTFCHTDPLFQRGQRRYHVKKHATKTNTSWSLLNFLNYSEQIELRFFATRVTTFAICQIFRVMVQLGKWFNLRGLHLIFLNFIQFWGKGDHASPTPLGRRMSPRRSLVNLFTGEGHCCAYAVPIGP